MASKERSIPSIIPWVINGRWCCNVAIDACLVLQSLGTAANYLKPDIFLSGCFPAVIIPQTIAAGDSNALASSRHARLVGTALAAATAGTPSQ